MRLYCTSKNTGPSYSSDPVYMVYLGPNRDDAIAAVKDFNRYEKFAVITEYPEIYSALPREIPREMIKWYEADGWWYSIVSIDFEEES